MKQRQVVHLTYLLAIPWSLAFVEFDDLATGAMGYPEQQAEYDWLVERWRRFEHRPFPSGWRGTNVEGICLVTLDAELAALVSSYVERRRQWHPRGIERLRRLNDDLRRVLPSLTGGVADYFTEWDELVATLLRLLDEE